ncbi:MAG: aminoglycoside 3-N-acetyltransferase [Chloroflexota bacterium]
MALVVSVAHVAQDLRRLGVAEGDVVMVHASLRAVGPVAGRAAGVSAALDEAVGSTGTVVMGLGARDDWGWVNDEPEDTRATLLADADPFDALRTPSDPDMGILAEIFRQTPGTLVSNHPEGRFGARGYRAKEFVTDVPWDDYYGPGSPLERLVNSGGKVLRLGADRETVTLLHYAEYLVPLQNKRRARRYRKIQTPAGPDLRVVECLDDAHGIVAWTGDDYFGLILSAYLTTGRARQGRVGDARSELLDAADFAAFGAAWMEREFTPERGSV